MRRTSSTQPSCAGEGTRAGWLALVILGAGHLLRGPALMTAPALDAWWISRLPDAGPTSPAGRAGDGTR